MTREEAINLLDNLIGMIEDNHNSDYDKALKMAIKSLEQEPCEDAISREEAIDACNQSVNILEATDRIKDLPPVYSKVKVGKWIPVSERLPEDEQEILFSTKTGRVHSGKYHDDDSANKWYSHKDKCRAWNNVVIAWMPLPKPYNAESEKKEKISKDDAIKIVHDTIHDFFVDPETFNDKDKLLLKINKAICNNIMGY